MEVVTKLLMRGVALLSCGVSLAVAQDSSSVDPAKSSTPAPVDGAPVKAVLTKDQLKAISIQLSSRYTPDEKETVAKNLGSKVRSIDPFGLPSYPKAAEEKPSDIIESTPNTAEPERITLGHALRTIKINGINLDRAEVLMGSRNMFEGDTAEILYKGQVFMAELTEVSGYRLVFVDTKTKEEFSKALSLLPAPNFEASKKLDSRLNLQNSARHLESVGK